MQESYGNQESNNMTLKNGGFVLRWLNKQYPIDTNAISLASYKLG